MDNWSTVVMAEHGDNIEKAEKLLLSLLHDDDLDFDETMFDAQHDSQDSQDEICRGVWCDLKRNVWALINVAHNVRRRNFSTEELMQISTELKKITAQLRAVVNEWVHLFFFLTLLQFIFNNNCEMLLLTEVAQADPYSKENPEEAWTELARNLRHMYMTENPEIALPTLMMRAVRDKVKLMLGYFHNDQRQNIHKWVQTMTFITTKHLLDTLCPGSSQK